MIIGNTVPCEQQVHTNEESTGINHAQLFGFENVGLTCYAGAALQCIQAISVQLSGKLAVE
jgi:ubiquitin C-terminal hydrolase